MSQDRTIARASRWNEILRSPRYNLFARCRGREREPSRSLPFREMGVIVSATEGGNSSTYALARRENVILR